MEREEVDVVGSVDRLRHSIDLVRDSARQCKLALGIHIHNGAVDAVYVPGAPRRSSESSWMSSTLVGGPLSTSQVRKTERRRAHEAGVVQHIDNLCNDLELVLWDIYPDVERRQELRADVLARIRYNIREWF